MNLAAHSASTAANDARRADRPDTYGPAGAPSFDGLTDDQLRADRERIAGCGSRCRRMAASAIREGDREAAHRHAAEAIECADEVAAIRRELHRRADARLAYRALFDQQVERERRRAPWLDDYDLRLEARDRLGEYGSVAL